MMSRMRLLSLCCGLSLSSPIQIPTAHPYIVHSFTFPHIPFHRGVRHIHTPERCVEAYAVLPPGFEIVRTHPPERIQAYHAVGFRFRTILCGRKDLHHGALFSSSADASQLLLMDAERVPYMLVTYSVRAYTPPRVTTAPFEGGHTLLVTGSYLRTPSELEALCTRRPVERQTVLNAIQSHHRVADEDAHLRAYRHRVLHLGPR